MNKEYLTKVILAPVISEKSTMVAERNRQFVFKVLKDANKIEIKDAIELLFGVKVDSVKVMNVKPKPKTFKGRKGATKAYKKAYVTLEEGHDISFGEA